MPSDKPRLYSLSEAHSFFARNFNGACWSLLEKNERSEEETAKMINLAHASLLHWSESKECRPANLQRGDWLISTAYAYAGRAEEALYYAKRCFELTFTNPGSMEVFDFAYAYLAMARASALTGLETEAKEYLSKMVEAAGQSKNNVDREIFINDLRAGDWFFLAEEVRKSVKQLGS